MKYCSIYGATQDIQLGAELLQRRPRFNVNFKERPGVIDHVSAEDAKAAKELVPGLHLEDCFCCLPR